MSWVIIHFRMFLRMMQWLNHCVLWQIFLVVVFVWAPAPFVWSGLLFLLTKRKSGWGFAGRLAGLCVVVVVVICLHFQTVLSLYKVTFYRLCSCKDRATVRHRPHSRKKKYSCPSTAMCRPHTAGSRRHLRWDRLRTYQLSSSIRM